MPPPLGIITTVFQAHETTSYPPVKAAFVMATTFSQFPGSGSSSCIAARIHILSCSDLMLDGPPARCSCSRITASEIFSSPGILSSTGKGYTSMEIGCYGGRTWAYSSTRSAVRVFSYTLARGGGLSAASLYHPLILTHISLTGGGYDARRESIVRPESSARLF